MTSTLKKLTALAAITLGSLSLASAPSLASDKMPGEGVTLKMAQADWDTGWFQARIYKQIFEKLGYKVDGPTTLNVPSFYSAVSTGDVDFWVNGWFPTQQPFVDQAKDQISVIGNSIPKGGIMGFMADKAGVEKYGITSLNDFKKPEVRKAYDRNGDGKADLVSCQLGWKCEVRIANIIKNLGLTDDVNIIHAKYTAAFADAEAAYKAGEHIAFYNWTPNWTFQELVPGKDVVWIEIPDNKEISDPLKLDLGDECATNPCQIGFKASDIQPVANNDFIKKNPAAAEILREVKIPVADVNAQNAAMHGGNTDFDAQAKAWIKQHQDEVNGWLDAARAAAKK